MERARRGEALTIGFLGGSITQGSLASREEKSYAYLVYRWWQETFEQTDFSYVNGGIGGTSSHYGAARAVTDLLMYQPDAVVVDFSVNDEEGMFFRETYEGVIRRILSWPSRPAVLLLHNVYYDSGKSAQNDHQAVGAHYGLPSVSIRDTVYQRMLRGEYQMEALTPDGLHPSDLGHHLVAKEIIRYLESVRQKEVYEPYREMILPAPLTDNAYEQARRLTIRESSPLLAGFRADVEEKSGHLDAFKNGWIGCRAGDRIIFSVEASCIAVQYRRSMKHPALSAQVILDGDDRHPVFLDGNFDEDWGDCQYLQPILHHGVNGQHMVEITVLPSEDMDKAVPFYLMSLILA